LRVDRPVLKMVCCLAEVRN